ncbi:MAG: polyprenol monophosphomannose synthase [Elusimicrobia bacterium]|nr:polyprenol monophosphomannose synthase [Elusimicrobiota bacterium]
MNEPRVLVILPTYNEAANLEPLLDALYGLGVPGLEVLVVDDQSPDGTAQLARRLRERRPGLRLIERSGPPGRGLAGRDGFLYAVERPEIEAVVEMDADFSHQPRHVPELLAALKGADMAIGSRRAAGGRDLDRTPARRVLTFFANFYARALLGLPVLDTNSGFRAYTRKALAAIDPATLASRGPSIVHEVLYRAARAKLNVREVPIDFLDRKAGESKLSLARLAAGYFWILRLTADRLARVFRRAPKAERK